MKDFFGLSVFIIIYCLFVFYMPDALGHPDNYIPANPLVTPPHIVPEWYFLPFYAILRAITFNMNLYMIVGFAVLAFLMVEFVWRKNPRILGYKLGTLLFLVGGALAAFGFMADLNQDWGIPLSAAESAPIPAKLGGVLAMFGSIAMLFILPWLDTHPIRSARFRPLFKLSFLLLFVLFVALGYIGSQAADATLFGIPLSLFGLAFTGYYFGFFLVILPLLNRFEKGRTLPSSIHEAVLAKSHSSHAGALA
jgi:ubiquinol-cytochrome c reductase cytochrome b subunit